MEDVKKVLNSTDLDEKAVAEVKKALETTDVDEKIVAGCLCVKKELDKTDLDEKIVDEVKKMGFLQKLLHNPCLSRTTAWVTGTTPSLQRTLSIRIPGQPPKKGTPLTAEPSKLKSTQIGV